MLTNQQRVDFSQRGHTRISGASASDELDRVSAVLWRKLEEAGIRKDTPATWRRPKPKGLRRLSKTSVFDALFEGAAQECLDILLGEEGWVRPKHWGQLLLSLPTDEDWFVPNTTWHLDLPQEIGDFSSPGVQIFVYLEDVLPKCGATVVAAGSHRLVGAVFLEDGLPGLRRSTSGFVGCGAGIRWRTGMSTFSRVLTVSEASNFKLMS